MTKSAEVKLNVGPMIAEGKTKCINEILNMPGKVLIKSKDDITAGDGAKHDVMGGKAVFSTTTTCNVFRLLKACGVPVAFEQQVSETEFISSARKMLPYEVVVRREAHGSYLKRAPHLEKGKVFPKLVFEIFLKTSGRKWKTYDLICDDPLMTWDSGSVCLYDPKQPNLIQTPAKPFLTLSMAQVFDVDNEIYVQDLLKEMEGIARNTFLILEKAWQLQGGKLVDFKVEFGLGPVGELLLADVIDNDSWRVLDAVGLYIDKQVYRDGGDLDTVTEKYRQVAELTNRFNLPTQGLLFWRGSAKDDLSAFDSFLSTVLKNYSQFMVKTMITCSVHKQPAIAHELLQQYLSNWPDTVIIACIGRSNGAGPVLSANTTVPVITVPVNYKEFPEDVWSSLRTPSYVPVMTVLEPANAVLAALQILAMRNPGIYAALRLEQENRMIDI